MTDDKIGGVGAPGSGEKRTNVAKEYMEKMAEQDNAKTQKGSQKLSTENDLVAGQNASANFPTLSPLLSQETQINAKINEVTKSLDEVTSSIKKADTTQKTENETPE
jgi:hypothetical protein